MHRELTLNGDLTRHYISAQKPGIHKLITQLKRLFNSVEHKIMFELYIYEHKFFTDVKMWTQDS